MSLASEVVQDAFDAIGRGSEILDTDQSLLDIGLLYLISCMETLRKNYIILEETVGAVTTTIAVPTALTDELDEPAAARMHLVNYLAVYLLAPARVDISTMKVPPAAFSFDQLRNMYYSYVPPAIIPSRLLPRGQGAGRSQGAFFQGEELDGDAATTT